MPITQSVKKALRQNKRRRARNVKNTRAVKAAIKEFEKLLVSDKAAAGKQLAMVYQKVDKLAKTKYIAKNKAARIKSRLAKKLEIK